MSAERAGRRVPPEPDERRADRFAIGHDAFQFRFDFWQGPDDAERPATRIVTTPVVAREFSQRLRESLRAHQRRVRKLATGTRETEQDNH